MTRHITVTDDQYWYIKKEMSDKKIKKYSQWVQLKIEETQHKERKNMIE